MKLSPLFGGLIAQLPARAVAGRRPGVEQRTENLEKILEGLLIPEINFHFWWPDSSVGRAED